MFSWYKYLIVGLVFSRLGFWSGNLFLIAPFPDLCLLVPLYGTPVTTEDQTLHLGVHRSTKCTPNTGEKINLGRRTAYSLMGAGFHGKSGLKQSIKASIWMKYVVQRLTYGLEVLSLRRKHIDRLEAFQRRTMKQLQGLPNKTSDTAALTLIGTLPISVCIEKTYYPYLEE